MELGSWLCHTNYFPMTTTIIFPMIKVLNYVNIGGIYNHKANILFYLCTMQGEGKYFYIYIPFIILSVLNSNNIVITWNDNVKCRGCAMSLKISSRP